MSESKANLVQRYFEALGAGGIEAAFELTTPDVVLDRRNSKGPWRGLDRGRVAARHAYRELVETVEGVSWEATGVRAVGRDLVVAATEISGHGRSSGVAVSAQGGWLLRIEDKRIAEGVLHQSFDDALLTARRRALAAARLYFVCEARPAGGNAQPLLDAALAGGVDVVQLRDHDVDDAALVAAARGFRAAADRHGALFFINDRPDLLGPCDADGVHVGQDDAPVVEARAVAGPAALVGLSTHSPDQFDAALTAAGEARPDQLSAGPVWETPTKQGRPAAGLALIAHAASAADPAAVPWFAIGGIDRSNLGEVLGAGARRAVVVRAIRDADDPEAAARELRAALAAAAAS